MPCWHVGPCGVGCDGYTTNPQPQPAAPVYPYPPYPMPSPPDKEAAALKGWAGALKEVNRLNEELRLKDLQNGELIERCAKIAESEPWPEDPAPAEVLEASKGLRYEQIVEAAVKATRESIAEKIRSLTEKRNQPCPKCGFVGCAESCHAPGRVESVQKCDGKMPGMARNNPIYCVLPTGHTGEHKDPVGIHWT